MKQYKSTFVILILSLSLSFFFSCGDDKKTETKQEPVTTEKKEDAQPKTISITLNSDDNMKFDQSTINVFEGQTVTLTLVHTGTMSADVMGHNFVLLTKGSSGADFAMAAITAKDTDYIPEDLENQVIAHTGVLGGGESETITFEAPAKGIYDFLCSFPGHYAMMKGKFIVR